MSSSLSFPCATAPTKAELARAATAEVRDSQTGTVVWLPGVSARGVLVSHADGRLNLRLLACVSDEDYAIAYRLAGALCDGDVEVESAGTVPARDLAERLADWQLRDRAMAFAALRASLAEGPVEISTFVRSVTLTDPSELDGVIARLCASTIPDVEVAIVVEGNAARIVTAPNVRAALARGPAGVQQMAPAAELPDTERTIVLVDLDAKRLLVSGGDALDWNGWQCTNGHDNEELAAYLGAKHLAVPRVRKPDPDPAVEAVVASLALGAEEYLADLRVQDRATPPPPPKRASPLTYLSLLVLLLCVPLRLVLLPFRGAAKRAHRRRVERFDTNVRAQLAKVAGAATDAERMDRAVYLDTLGYKAIADRELSRCLDREPKKALIRHNRGVVRIRPFPRLARLDLDAAQAAGYRQPTKIDWRSMLYFFVGV